MLRDAGSQLSVSPSVRCARISFTSETSPGAVTGAGVYVDMHRYDAGGAPSRPV